MTPEDYYSYYLLLRGDNYHICPFYLVSGAMPVFPTFHIEYAKKCCNDHYDSGCTVRMCSDAACVREFI